MPRFPLRSTCVSTFASVGVLAAPLLLALILSVATATSALAQPPPAAANRIFLPVALGTTLLDPPAFDNWAYFRTSQVLSIALDEPNGVVWGGTDAGLVRWDRRTGARITFTTRDGLASDRVTDVALDADGSVWLAHDDLLGGSTNPAGGAGVSHRSTLGNWSRVTTADGLASNVVYAIERAPDGAMWFGTIDGVSRRLPAGEWATYKDPSITSRGFGWHSFISMTFDRGANLWLGNAFGLSRRAADGSWKDYSFGGPIVAITADAEGNAWFARDSSDGVTAVRPDSNGVLGSFTFTQHNGLHSNSIQALALDAAGNRWFASYDGISRLAADGQSWSYALDPNAFASLNIQDVVIDAAGEPWIATLGHVQGLGVDGSWRALDTEVQLGSSHVSDIIIDAAGRPWISTMASGFAPSGGVSTLGADGAWTFYRPVAEAHPGDPTVRTDHHVHDLALDRDGSLWIATNAGAVKRTPDGRWTHYTQRSGLASDEVRAVEVDRQGNVWFANAEGWGERGVGLSKLAPSGAWEHFTTRDGLASDNITMIAVNRRGDRWFGHYEGFSILTAEGSWQQRTGFEGGVRAIAFDRADNAWIGTGAGVIRLSADGRTSTRFGKAEGLPRDDVQAIAVDPLGQVWVGTSAGAARQAPNDRFSAVISPGQTPSMAFRWNQLTAIAFSPRGEAWFGSQQGAAVLR